MFCDCCAVTNEEWAEGSPIGAGRTELIEPAVSHYNCGLPVQITQLVMRY
jgi:hypothetical protein